MAKAFHLSVFGRVQGVGFRFFTKEQADSLNLSGFVKNKPDGSVEIHVEGPEESVYSFIEWCHYGPSSAKVERLEYSPVSSEDYDGFIIDR